jgi:mannose-6-phosphate isomerase-like protein (cupin superfamily)
MEKSCVAFIVPAYREYRGTYCSANSTLKKRGYMGEFFGGAIDLIGRLETLNKCAPSLSDLVAARKQNVVEYEVDGGWSIGYGISNDKECAIQKNFTTGGSLFPTHALLEHVYYIILEGEGVVIVGEEKREFKAKDCITVPPGVAHSWYYRKHTRYIGVTIPASEGFPSGKK